MENKSNIIEYIKESVLPKIGEAKHIIYLTLGRGFEELGDRGLYYSHTELAQHFKTKAVILSSKYNQSGGALDDLIKAFDDKDMEILTKKQRIDENIPSDFKDTSVTQFTMGELRMLSDKDLWFSFISNSMIKHFITKINEQLNDINKRKKLNEILQYGGKTVDISALKLLMGEDDDSDGGVYYTSSTIMPRWDIGKHHNGDELLKKFNNEILNHLEIDGFSTNNDDKKVEEADDQIQA